MTITAIKTAAKVFKSLNLIMSPPLQQEISIFYTSDIPSQTFVLKARPLRACLLPRLCLLKFVKSTPSWMPKNQFSQRVNARRHYTVSGRRGYQFI